ncbi:MAG: hypothetical protein IJG50_08685 [Clostridia bacterium]|nr:hypothetical protein [Clostridia bacterium]
MQGGLFIALYDENTLKLYLKRGIYGFLMKPVFTNQPSSRSRHYAILADYACSREGSDLFFFLNRKIVYGGKIYGNKKSGSFYINGKNSPLGIKSQANLFWDETERYVPTEKEGVFKVKGAEKAQPYIFQFHQNADTGKYIASDDLYFELGKYPYPLPSNSMQGMGFCTLTPGEVSVLMNKIQTSDRKLDFSVTDEINKKGDETIFDESMVDIKDDFINEAQLEFTILSSLKPFASFLTEDYILCRQVPISPFKPMDMDRADICLYSMSNPIKDGTIPNIVIELKRGKASYKAYEQVNRYLKWIEQISTKEEFENVRAYIIADSFAKIHKEKVDTIYADKIGLFSISKMEFEEIE